ncbi:NPCBM/NEW2 domain-containing protein [Haladaptatus pallidirubidus]|uniref:Glycosyl hydrolase family 98 putative carbohydrate-binding module domain-containing protein n=1 Tax=Haladaptatus pallidirubidus TaxID=1008152 RepID=A0AAV3UPC7_9EURY
MVNATDTGADGQAGKKVDEIPFPGNVTADGGLIENYRDPARLTAPEDEKPADIYVAGKPRRRAPEPGPDLTIDGREFTVESVDEQTWRITVPIANVGADQSPATTAALLDVTDEQQHRLTTFDVPALDVNEYTILTYDWDTSMVSAGRYELQAVVDPHDEIQESTETNNASPTAEITVAKPPTSDTYLSDLQWVDATIGWGEIGLDESVEGNPITIGGTTYEKGIGTHARSEITYNLGENMSRFVSDVGVDDEVEGDGSVGFKVVGDGETLAETDVLTGSGGATHLDVDVSGVDTLTLVVTDGGNGIDSDHADWAAARVLT